MGIVILIIVLIIAIVAVVFAVQNTATVSIAFLAWQSDGSLALVLLIALAIGAIIGLLVVSPALVRRGLRISKQKKKIAELDVKLQESNNKITEIETLLKEKEEVMAEVRESDLPAFMEPIPEVAPQGESDVEVDAEVEVGVEDSLEEDEVESEK